MNIETMVTNQRKYFMSGATRPVEFRLDALKKLQSALRKDERELFDALRSDLNKSDFESYMSEVGMVLDELHFHIRHLSKWAKPKHVKTPMAQFHAKSFVIPEPFGVALILSPWNYPLQLCLEPLVGAISAGNCAIVKPSAYAPATSHAIAKLIASLFPAEYIAVIEGGREENNQLLAQKFDYIFFTGSMDVGRVVMEAASKHLTPVTLELGGKSPVIVDKTANLKLAARRIAVGKVLNAGQTCVEPDYLLIHKDVRDAFIEQFREALKMFFPGGDMRNMPTIINEKHYKRVVGLITGEKAVIGGGHNDERRFIEPTVLIDVTPESPIMGEEIFGPVLPVITYSKLDEAIDFVNARKKPLALYVFTDDNEVANAVLSRTSSGGGCVNDTIIHLATPHMGFGGVGDSGMGSYHGKLSFDTFTHYKSIVKKSTFIDLPMRYHPYTDKNFSLLRLFLK